MEVNLFLLVLVMHSRFIIIILMLYMLVLTLSSVLAATIHISKKMMTMEVAVKCAEWLVSLLHCCFVIAYY
jgi:hypothetical protein